MAERSRAGILGGVLIVVVLLAGAAWWFRGDLVRLLGAPEATEVSPEAAAAAAAKLDRLRSHGETAELSSVELTSFIRYRAPAAALETLREPSVRMSGDTIRLSGRIPTDRLPPHPDLDRVRAFLPDTAPLVIQGRVEPLGAGRVALDIQGVQFAGVPIPPSYYPAMLERLGRRPEPGLPPAAVAVALPPGVGAARVEEGHLVLSPPAH
jgi:hypothetical protein